MPAKQITVRITPQLLAELEGIAKETGQRVGTVASRMLADGVARHCGLNETPPEWRINGVGQWKRK